MTPYTAARSGAFIYIRSHGLANMQNASVLDAFLRTEIESGCREVCIDLSACTGMDSTFMGTLVGFGDLLQEDAGRLVVVNPGPRNRALLDTLGVSTVLPVFDERQVPLEDESAFAPLDCSPEQSTLQRMAMIKDAHERLVTLNNHNQKQFAPFIAALEADLRRLSAQDEAD
jgi:anti-sigma B factor antagonist